MEKQDVLKEVKLNICGSFLVPENWSQEDINKFLDSCHVMLESSDSIGISVISIIDIEITE